MVPASGVGPRASEAPHYDSRGRLKHYCTADACPDFDENTMRALPAPAITGAPTDATIGIPDVLAVQGYELAPVGTVAALASSRAEVEAQRASRLANEAELRRADERIGALAAERDALRRTLIEVRDNCGRRGVLRWKERTMIQAVFYDETGALLWTERWYLRRMHDAGETFVRESVTYTVVASALTKGQLGEAALLEYRVRAESSDG